MPAFDQAVRILEAGLTGEAALDEFMRVTAGLGDRYCPLALELILATFEPEVTAPAEQEILPVGSTAPAAELFPGEFSWDGVPAEPVPEEEEVF